MLSGGRRIPRILKIGLLILVAITLLAVVGPLFVQNPWAQNYNQILLPPGTPGHVLGTDEFGRDILSRVVYGSGVSLLVAGMGGLIAGAVGIAVGILAGYYGGLLEEVLMRFVDFMLSIPVFFLLLVAATIFSSDVWVITAVLGLTLWVGIARLERAEFKSFKERDFVVAAESAGANSFTIIFKEILPNAIFPAVVAMALIASSAVLIQASLAFLGVGNQDVVSLGGMVYDAFDTSISSWWLVVYPGAALSAISVSLYLISDGLNAMLNVR